MSINRIYETQKISVAVACFFPGRDKALSALLYELMWQRIRASMVTRRRRFTFVSNDVFEDRRD